MAMSSRPTKLMSTTMTVLMRYWPNSRSSKRRRNAANVVSVGNTSGGYRRDWLNGLTDVVSIQRNGNAVSTAPSGEQYSQRNHPQPYAAGAGWRG